MSLDKGYTPSTKNVSISSPSGEGGELRCAKRVGNGGRQNVSISSPSGEGGELRKGGTIHRKLPKSFPLVLLQVKAVRPSVYL